MRHLLILSLFLVCQPLVAQNDTWKYYAPPNEVSCLSAANNTILAGTNGAGIVRFDTLLHRTYYHTGNTDLPSDTLLQIAIDAKGDWWIQHPVGISRYNGSTWQSWLLDQTGLPLNAMIRALKAAPDSSLYVATDNGVAIYKNMAWSVLNTTNSGLLSNNVWDIAFNPDGKVYYATSTTGLVVQDGSNWSSYTSANTGISSINNVFSVACTTSGAVWICGGPMQSAQIRLARFEQGIWTGFNAANIGVSGGGLLRKLTADNNNRLWLTTSYSVSLLENQVWTHHYFNTDVGCYPVGASASAPALAGSGQVWLQACDVAVFDGQDWLKPGTGLPGPPDGVFYNGIAEDQDGNIWTGAASGGYIAKFDGIDWQPYYPTDFGASGNDVYSVQAANNGPVWFGLDNAEILKFDNGNWTYFDTCSTIFADLITLSSITAPNGDQWFSFHVPENLLVNSGIARYDVNGQWQFYTPVDFPDLQNTYIKKIVFEPNGTGWFVTGYKGLLKYDGVSWEFINTSNSDLPNNRVWDIDLAPDGSIWVCTDSGIARFDGQNWTNFTTANSGLPSNTTRGIAFDQAGSMYVGYFPEVSGTTGNTVALLRNGVWSTITPPGWESIVNPSPDAFITDSQNRLWLAEFYYRGVYRYDPMLVNTAEPTSEIGQIKISPNPCSEHCKIMLETPANQELQVRIHNTIGQLVLENPSMISNDLTLGLDISGLPAGLYWATVWNKNTIVGMSPVIKH